MYVDGAYFLCSSNFDWLMYSPVDSTSTYKYSTSKRHYHRLWIIATWCIEWEEMICCVLMFPASAECPFSPLSLQLDGSIRRPHCSTAVSHYAGVEPLLQSDILQHSAAHSPSWTLSNWYHPTYFCTWDRSSWLRASAWTGRGSLSPPCPRTSPRAAGWPRCSSYSGWGDQSWI